MGSRRSDAWRSSRCRVVIAGVGLACITSALHAFSQAARADFLEYSVLATTVESSGQNLVRYEIYAHFDGATDTILNVYNFSIASETGDAHAGFWHKDNNDDASGVLSQNFGTWSPALVGSPSANRPYDSFLSIGAATGSSSTSTADPSWSSGGSGAHSGDARGWSRPDLVSNGVIGWYNASPPNLQGRVGQAGNLPFSVRVAQFVLSLGHAARSCTLRVAWNNGAGGAVQFSDAAFTLESCVQTKWYRDLDGDGLGNAPDGVTEACTQPAGYALEEGDNCPTIANVEQRDCDGDGVGDACEIAAGTTDLDQNGIPDDCAGEWIVGGSGFGSIQAAIDAAPDGATVLVGEGTWSSIALVDRTIAIRALGDRASTVIDGSSSTRCVAISSVSAPTQAGFPLIEGFTIRRGNAAVGAGMLIVDTSPTIRACVFEENFASSNGGAARIERSSATFDACTFAENRADIGGAVSIASTLGNEVVRFQNCDFIANEATTVGGTIANLARAELHGGVVLFSLAGTGSAAIDAIGGVATAVDIDRLCGNRPTHTIGAVSVATTVEQGKDCDLNGICDLDELEEQGADTDHDGKLDRCERAGGDLNLDGIVNTLDLSTLLFAWTTANTTLGDIDGDGSVGSGDLSIVLGAWGTQPS